MKGMIFKKASLLGGIFLLSTFILVQLSWGCDDHGKWDCDHNGKPCQPPKIQRVFLEYQADSIVFEIWGKNFGNGAPPVVTLGGIFDLTVDDALTDDNVITATLSSIAEKNFEFGDYRLVVSTCPDSACNDKYCKDHGPKCKCKYCKNHCSKFKGKYCKDHEYQCKCKDRYSLTIPGPSGQPSTIGQKIVTDEGKISANGRDIEGTAYCDEVNDTGYVVTGGGFEASKSFNVMISMPVKSDQFGYGWYVLGTANNLSEAPLSLKIYGVCAKIK
jgi:hypothetical protein